MQPENDGGPASEPPHPLSIESLKNGEYPGSDLVIEQTLDPGSNYSRQIVSYKSEGLKIYALLTIPNGTPPAGGWPIIIFNHGYIPPKEYRTTERYLAYTDAFSRAGYVLLKPDYRGHGNSEGEATGGYGTNDYSIDVLNAVSSIKKYSGVNPEKIGMWGHSMGGSVTLKNMVVRKDIKAGVIWAGVVASYPDLVERWRRRSPQPTLPGNTNMSGRSSWRQNLIAQFGEPSQNPDFWAKLSANSYLSDISGPLQLHHGTSDSSVPIEMSVKLDEQLKAAGKEVEYFEYPGDDHNLANNLGVALQRSVAFFDKYLK
ncbi:peptidase [Candidatus Daviesbacteria bacterium RIFCSPHIGHO2_01_FULL_36_37]|nr:MAG: peptidase [Candidatus Daviesbacteria bacterium RIFCSPHIGHO2_01_FULL_36_37]OGE31268.1 MAG: peptidase [Candidatus Daviesbacteria bacterium RIFCSPHIGHO2_02_FULL_37_9]OGE36033.1 MAG: peptidase [Candidatus Daviesbacteria bacterium RIFCSPHIGHO2_12_FULL_37_16]